MAPRVSSQQAMVLVGVYLWNTRVEVSELELHTLHSFYKVEELELPTLYVYIVEEQEVHGFLYMDQGK